MNPKQFLQIGGVILVLVGILGLIGIIGPTPDSSIFGEAWWFDQGENGAHLILGVVALIAAFAIKCANAQKWLVILVGILGLAVGIAGFVIGGGTVEMPNFLGANLENPADNILHLGVGLWALLAGSFGKNS